MSVATEIEKAVCRRCFAVVDATDSFCRYCGLTLGADPPPADLVAELVPSPAERPTGRFGNRWLMLALVLAAAGPLGLPVLWRSRQFSLRLKVVLTAIILGLTVAAVAWIWHTIDQALAPLRNFNALHGCGR